jgi:hypothetical protein
MLQSLCDREMRNERSWVVGKRKELEVIWNYECENDFTVRFSETAALDLDQQSPK